MDGGIHEVSGVINALGASAIILDMASFNAKEALTTPGDRSFPLVCTIKIAKDLNLQDTHHKCLPCLIRMIQNILQNIEIQFLKNMQ